MAMLNSQMVYIYIYACMQTHRVNENSSELKSSKGESSIIQVSAIEKSEVCHQ